MFMPIALMWSALMREALQWLAVTADWLALKEASTLLSLRLRNTEEEVTGRTYELREVPEAVWKAEFRK